MYDTVAYSSILKLNYASHAIVYCNTVISTPSYTIAIVCYKKLFIVISTPSYTIVSCKKLYRPSSSIARPSGARISSAALCGTGEANLR